jgi:hypothetical protein
VWSDCAQAELWLAGDARGACPKPRVVCRRCEAKPRLDGRLDDAVWQSAQSVPLRANGSHEKAPSTIVAVAHDGEFLYFAVSCQRAAGLAYEPEKQVRSRDAELSKHDRVDILLDINRDYASYYRLTVDARGWTHDSCFGDATWDPTWYVGSSGDASYWTVEAAVPMAELASTHGLEGSVWAIGLQRAVPTHGIQSWSKPADLEVVPAGFGLLQFE